MGIFWQSQKIPINIPTVCQKATDYGVMSGKIKKSGNFFYCCGYSLKNF